MRAAIVALVWSAAACNLPGQGVQSGPTTISVMSEPGAVAAQKPGTPAPPLDLNKVGALPDSASSVSLPRSFVGCWEGTINGYDTLVPIGISLPKGKLPLESLRMCYVLDADGRTSALVLLDDIIDGKERRPIAFESQIVWTDGSRTAYLRNHMALNGISWILIIPISHRGDIYADEIIELENSNSLKMRGVELLSVDGRDVARIAFHADFHRVPMPVFLAIASTSAAAVAGIAASHP